MSLPRVVVWIERDDFDAFKRMAPSDTFLTEAYDEWLAIARQQVEELRANGQLVRQVVVRPHEFEAYCQKVGIAPDGTARMAFAVLRALKGQAPS